MIAPDLVPADEHEHYPASEVWTPYRLRVGRTGRRCTQRCLCRATRVVYWPPVDPVLGAGQPIAQERWQLPRAPGAVVRGLLHPTVERISDADPIPGLQRLQLQIERLITVHADRAVTDPVVSTYLEVVADLERQDAREGAR